jgi:predicted N-acetyltransferase YhbS
VERHASSESIVDLQRILPPVGQDSVQINSMAAYPIPVVILARLAVASNDQGRGIGVSMSQDAIRRTVAIAEQAGVRALLAHPLDEDAQRFYLRFGFEASPVQEQQLLVPLKDARRLLMPSVSGQMGVKTD